MSAVIRNRGKAAFFSGLPRAFNPYKFRSACWFLWDEGYGWAEVHYGQVVDDLKTGEWSFDQTTK